MVKLYSYNGLKGCVQQFRARATGTLLGLYHAEQAGIAAEAGSPWATVCEEHSTMVLHSSLAQARKVHNPRAFCDACREAIVMTCPTCTRDYSHATFERLPLVGPQDDGEGGWLELRNCKCHSTLTRETTAEKAAQLRVRRSVPSHMLEERIRLLFGG
jgi:hypothetical protein